MFWVIVPSQCVNRHQLWREDNNLLEVLAEQHDVPPSLYCRTEINFCDSGELFIENYCTEHWKRNTNHPHRDGLHISLSMNSQSGEPNEVRCSFSTEDSHNIWASSVYLHTPIHYYSFRSASHSRSPVMIYGCGLGV